MLSNFNKIKDTDILSYTGYVASIMGLIYILFYHCCLLIVIFLYYPLK